MLIIYEHWMATHAEAISKKWIAKHLSNKSSKQEKNCKQKKSKTVSSIHFQGIIFATKY